MTDLHRAIAEIDAIRGHLARSTEFRGYGPAAIAATGGLGALAAVVQGLWVTDPMQSAAAYVTLWFTTAALCVLVIGVETVTRSMRVHRGLARAMLHSAAEQFAPAIVGGALLTIVLLRTAPETSWMLPGLWQLLFSMSVFASCRFLPRPTFAVGVWYLGTGLACLAVGPLNHPLSPWAMGVPFGVGQLLVAAILQLNYRHANE